MEVLVEYAGPGDVLSLVEVKTEKTYMPIADCMNSAQSTAKEVIDRIVS